MISWLDNFIIENKIVSILKQPELLGLGFADKYLLNARMGSEDIISLCVYFDLYALKRRPNGKKLHNLVTPSANVARQRQRRWASSVTRLGEM